MYSVAVTTAGSKAEAQTLARALLEAKKAACIQCFPIDSFYVWEGAVQEDAEFCLLIKCRAEHFEDLKRIVTAAHSYDVPELIRLDIADGLPAYLDWIGEVTAA